MDALLMVGRILDAVWMSPRVQVHPAWVDETTAAICTHVVSFSFSGTPSVQVVPCEVPIHNAYPALGIAVQESPSPSGLLEGLQALEQLPEVQECLPAKVAGVRVWDALGEGPASAIQVALESGVTLIVRHMYPPMSLGVDVLRQGNSSKAA
jgi:hypothetical protein